MGMGIFILYILSCQGLHMFYVDSIEANNCNKIVVKRFAPFWAWILLHVERHSQIYVEKNKQLAGQLFFCIKFIFLWFSTPTLLVIEQKVL